MDFPYLPYAQQYNHHRPVKHERFLDPIYMVFDAIMNFKKEQTEKLLSKLTTAHGNWSRTC